MTVFYINYSDINYRDHQNFLVDTIKKNNLFDDAEAYTREWLETTDFYKENKNILHTFKIRLEKNLHSKIT